MSGNKTKVWDGRRPRRSGDLTLETAGITPVPPEDRYAKTWWMLPVWFTPNMEVSSLFIGTLGAGLGLGFGWGAAALATGIVLGAIPVAVMATWGPRTGTAQVALARIPFGKSIVVPAALQWLTAIGWIALGCFFGAQAAQLLFHVSFWAAALIVIGLATVVGIVGYELAVQVQQWGAVLMAAFFALVTARIVQHHVGLPRPTEHGLALAAAFALMTAIAISGSLSWASCASDYSRYLRPTAPRAAVFWYTLAGMTVSYGWLAGLGLAAASVLSDQTAGGIAALVGGHALGDAALAAIIYAAVAAAAINNYSASLALQALEARLRRPLISMVSGVAAFGIILWMHDGSMPARFEDILLLAGYGLAPFAAIVLIDWCYRGQQYTPGFLHGALEWDELRAGWAALAAFCLGFAASVPFMDTSIIVGPVARHLDGADLAYPAGFAITGVLYMALRPGVRRRAARRRM